jgi:cobalt/nickel transport protein
MEKKMFILLGIGIAVLIGLLAVFLASGDPDGLESTALVVQGDKSLTGATPENAEIKEDLTGKFSYEAPLPDYTMGEAWGKPGEAIAIIVGIFLAFAAVFGALKLIKVSEKNAGQNKGSGSS